jgi:uncharacterized protein (UPF0335 family)
MFAEIDRFQSPSRNFLEEKKLFRRKGTSIRLKIREVWKNVPSSGQHKKIVRQKIKERLENERYEEGEPG